MRGNKATERMRERERKRTWINTTKRAGWLCNSIHRNIHCTYIMMQCDHINDRFTSAASGFKSNMLRVKNALSHPCHKHKAEENIKHQEIVVKPYYKLYKSQDWSVSFLYFLSSSLPHKIPHSRLNQSAVTNPSFFTM